MEQKNEKDVSKDCFDFDEFFKEQNEAEKTFKLKGKIYTIPGSPTLASATCLQRIFLKDGADTELAGEDLENMGIAILGKNQFEQMMNDGVTIKEFEKIFEYVWDQYKPTEPIVEPKDGELGKNS